MSILITFSFLTIINVIFSTIKSIATIKLGKTVAAIVSAGYYGYYNIVLIYTVANFPLWQKVVITFLANLIGVWLVKWCEEKLHKEQLWKIEVTFKLECLEKIQKYINSTNIPQRLIIVNKKWCYFEFYCSTQKETVIIKNIINKFNGKYFISENRAIL